MTIRYAFWVFATSARRQYSKGNNAPPRLPIISSDDPIRVNLPSPSIARGQTEGHIKEFAIPSKAINTTDISFGDATAAQVNKIPRIAQTRSALLCEIYRGMTITPIE